MEPLTFETACKIVEATSSIYQQGDAWVLRVWDLEAGAERLTRGLSLRKASTNLMSWRKSKIDELLRNDPEQSAWIIHIWEENPTWKGAGLWQSAESSWHLTKGDAQKRLDELKVEQPGEYELKAVDRTQLPHHFGLHQHETFVSSLETSLERAVQFA